MTVGLSSANLATAWLNVLRGGGNGVTFTAPAALFVQIHTGDPGASGTSAVSVGSTTRQTLSFAAPSAGTSGTATIGASWTNGGTSETLNDVSVWSASTSGTFYFSGALTSPQPWASGNTFTLTALSVALTPIAA